MSKAALTFIGTLLLFTGLHSAYADDRLTPDQQLNPGKSLRSPNGKYALTMREDGCLQLHTDDDRPLWASNTFAPGAIVRMQGDGNLVIYAPGHKAVWDSDSSKKGSSLVIKNSGNIVVEGADGKAVWGIDANDDPKKPVVAHLENGNMSMHVKVSRNGTIEAERSAGIKKQSGSYRHIFIFALLDKDDNTLFISPVETLTIGAKVTNLGRPSYVGKDETETYHISDGKAAKVCQIVAIFKQEHKSGGFIDILEEAVKNLERLDELYKRVKDLDSVKDGSKAFATPE